MTRLKTLFLHLKHLPGLQSSGYAAGLCRGRTGPGTEVNGSLAPGRQQLILAVLVASWQLQPAATSGQQQQEQRKGPEQVARALQFPDKEEKGATIKENSWFPKNLLELWWVFLVVDLFRPKFAVFLTKNWSVCSLLFRKAKIVDKMSREL